MSLINKLVAGTVAVIGYYAAKGSKAKTKAKAEPVLESAPLEAAVPDAPAPVLAQAEEPAKAAPARKRKRKTTGKRAKTVQA
ncbi:MAG: hypothetical protein JWP01_401 [Myxococcales bacterium]|nr:hypothetical protein [Myxococcales bacterium]